jgi:glycosyltransferase involved in cell wall biosynthesis
MRALVLSSMYPPHHLGGLEVACQAGVRGLRERGHEALVLASRLRLPGREGPDEARRVLNLFWDDGVWRRPGLAGAIRATAEDLAALRETVAAFRPDVVWAWHLAALSKVLLSEARALGLPVVLSLGELWPLYDLEPDPWLRWCRGVRAPVGRAIGAARGFPTRVPRLAEDAADAAYNSEWLQNELAGRGLTPRGRVIYPGVDPARFPAAPLRDGPVRRFLQVGRVEPRKGQTVAVEALAKLRAAGVADATLTVAGAAEAGHDVELRALAERLGVADAVSFTGPVPFEAVAGLYAEHDAAIHAATWQEPFGLALVEAMASGRPLVCSPTGGAREIVTSGEDALAFEPGDAAGCAARMEALATDRGLAERLVAAGRTTALRFTEERAAEEQERQLLEVLGR